MVMMPLLRTGKNLGLHIDKNSMTLYNSKKIHERRYGNGSVSFHVQYDYAAAR
jgi:hypothetical protein